MGETTEISWCDSTFNPWIGCTKVSPGCANCYAERYGARFGVGWGPGQDRRRTSVQNWNKPLAWNRAQEKARRRWAQLGAVPPRPRHRVFCASLADWLDPEIPAVWLAELLGVVLLTGELDWMLLTKRPQLWAERLQSLAAIYPPPSTNAKAGKDLAAAWLLGERPHNVWVGTTVEDQKRAEERIPHLLAIPARIRFLSCEPLLGRVVLPHLVNLPGDVTNEPILHVVGMGATVSAGRHLAFSNRNGALSVRLPGDGGLFGIKPGEFEDLGLGVDWIITGGESGPGARPMHPEWARSLLVQARRARVAFHHKQNGEFVGMPVYPGPRDVDEGGCELDPCGWSDEHSGFEQRVLDLDGGEHDIERDGQPPPGSWYLARVGRERAGRQLAGREWDGFPQA